MCDIYLVDDDQDVLNSLSWMLDGLGLKTQGFLNAASFLSAVDITRPGIAILDIQMPGMDGIALLHHIKVAASPMSVIMLTGHGTITMAVQAIQQGAIDFLEKPVDGDKLSLLLARAKEISLQSFDELRLQTEIEHRVASLTPREHEVMLKVLEGKLNKVIAAELNIAQRTIELHRQKVMQKMQVSNAAELAYLMAKSEE
ncbi:two component transcriptional regulator, LuxR family [Shewanella sediminis HAW-EB3]|uniref:Two component transcriptional regulator, LuxR family n=1 Tax=Shewanella sediminis (strain HAW-EB3) TaxID=425104 RepID=A8FVL8_SHESH|nr:response regulator [Shewanella sediminis]ABV36891.1 two component transcriptional regulator, LuxR family [Shewanella sediminis HAW-EB3]